MSGISCDCNDPSFGHAGRTNCVVTQKALAFPIFSPQIGSTGERNFLPANDDGITLFNTQYSQSFTTLAECFDYRLAATTPALDMLYPILKVENATFERTETAYETAPSGRKIKLDGVGGIRTWAMELWGDDAAFGVARAVNQFGCSDLDVYYVDVTGNLWGIQDTEGSGELRGYEMSTETFDNFMMYSTDTSGQKITLSWDLDAYECEENAWAITAEEYGEKFTNVEPLIQGIVDVASASTSITVVDLSTSFGTAGNKTVITGLAPDLATGNQNFVIESGGLQSLAADITENPDGTYTITVTLAPDSYTLTTTATGYQVPVASFTVA